MLPRVAIVGRPNAGKSSLMNMIAKAKVSIVDPTPGVTRDRVSAIVELEAPTKGDDEGKTIEFMDTGGFGVYVAEGGRYDEIGNDLAKLTDSIEFQIAKAVEGADLILFAIDAQAGITPADEQIARMLREGGFRKRLRAGEQPAPGANKKTPPVRIIATKVDGPRWEAHAAELSALGFGEPIMVSAKNNYMRREFLDTIYNLVPKASAEDAQQVRADLMLAIIGKRNAGKSTLINTLAGEQRVIASEVPGTTRDAIDVRFEMDGRSVVAIDTAGLRRKRSFQNMIEEFAFDRVKRSVDRCDVVILLIDATEKISQVDEQLAMLAQKSFKPCVIVVNKWDMAQGRRNDKGEIVTPKHFETYIRNELRGLWYAPISFISGASGLNVRRTIDLAFEMVEQARERVTTGKLNRMVRSIIDERGPADLRGRFAKLFYVAQTGVEPPTITMVVNHPEMFTANYMRFLTNRFREELPFTEVPLRIVVRARRQREDDLVSAEEGGEGATIRVARGRKGVSERLTGNLALGEEDDRWLSDEFSVAAPGGVESGEEAEGDDVPSAADLRKPAKGRKSDHEGFDDVDDTSDMDFDDGDAGDDARALMDDFDKPAAKPGKPQAVGKPTAKQAEAAEKPVAEKKTATKKAAKKAAKPAAKKAAGKASTKPAKATKKVVKKAAKKPAAKKAAKKKVSKKK
ncbi:MAG TPA: ribosome biogenesis GTPase Der [Phycisphaerales bacterium]|nr:ribosome biogenesis GTPase Der [Phycisphaerales bacterium]